MMSAMPHLIFPPEKPALVRSGGDMRGLLSIEKMQGRLARKVVLDRALLMPVFVPGVPPPIALVATASAGSSIDASSYAFNGVGIAGSFDGIVVTVGTRRNATETVSSVTVNGSTATYAGARAASSEEAAEIWAVKLLASGAVNVVVNLSGTVLACAVGVVAVTGLVNASATGIQTSTSNPASLTTTVSSGGVLIGSSSNANSGGATSSWTNMTKIYDSTNLDGSYNESAAYSLSTGSVAAQVSWSGSVGAASMTAAYR